MTKLIEVKIPSLSETVTEGEISQWLKSIGDYVTLDDALLELETEKVTMELPSPISGILREINAEVGEVVHVDQVVCKIEETDAISIEKLHAPSPVISGTLSEHIEPVSSPNLPQERKLSSSSSLSPSASVEMKKFNLSVDQISPTGPKGNILKEDVLRATSQQVLCQKDSDHRNETRIERVKMSKLRRVISQRLKEAQNTAALLTTFNEINMCSLMSIRKKYKELFEKRHGIRLGMMSFFTKAVVMALQEFPAINAEIDGDSIVYKNFYDIGIAVGSPRGLVVPVLRSADTLSFSEIEKQIARFGQRAKDGELTMEEMSGGTFTITNGGIFGSLLSTPIINFPQSAILGMHAMQKRPICNENGNIEVADMMYVALTYDHRIIDGREAVSFLVRIKKTLEDPIGLLLDV